MRLRRLTIRTAPGISHPFTVEEIAPRLNLMVGPNGSGKSTVRRAVRSLLWPADASGASTASAVEAVFEDEEHEYYVRREGAAVQWQRDGNEIPAPEFGGAHLADCFSLGITDLAIEGSAENLTLTEVIRRELSGGHDLTPLFKKNQPRKSLAHVRTVNDAEGRVNEVEHDFLTLAQEEDRRAALEQELAAAEAARVRERLLTRAHRNAVLQSEQNNLEAQRSTLPEALAAFTGREEEDLEERETKLREIREDLERIEAETRDATSQRETSRLQAPLPAAELNARRDAAKEIGGLAPELKQAKLTCDEKQRAAETAQQALGGEARQGVASDLSAEDLRRLESAVRETEEASARCEAARKWTERLRTAASGPAIGDAEDSEPVPEHAVDHLRTWLATPPPTPARAMFAFGGLAAAGTLAILVWSLWGGPAGALGFAAAASAVVLLLLAGLGLRPSAARIRARQDYEACGAESPETWDAKTVRALAARLAQRAAELAARDQQKRESTARLRDAESDMRREEDALTAARGTLRACCEELGLDTPDGARLEPLVMAHRFHDAELARHSLAEADARREALEAEFRTKFDTLADWLVSHDYPAPGDAHDLQAAVEDLRSRSQAYESAEGSLAALEERRKVNQRRREEAESARANFFTARSLAVGDHDALRRLLDAYPRWRELSEEIANRNSLIAEGRKVLEDAPELLEKSQEELARELADAEQEAARVSDLSAAISAIDTRVDEAGKQSRLAEALAARDGAAHQLAEERSDAMQKAAAHFLLEDIAREHETEKQPDVVREAKEYFRAFTRNHYALVPPAAGSQPGPFRAKDLVTGRGLDLSELSDGTRIQLLLAVRLAFVKNAELSGPLPVFLDEALSTADLERLAAVAECLHRLAEEGRQIFYLTANSGDVRSWREVTAGTRHPEPGLIDLGAIRNRAAVPEDVKKFVPPTRETIPEPGALAPEAYARLLEVPDVDLLGAPEAVPLYYLLSDDLPLLHRVMRDFKFRHLGPWEDLRASRRASELVADDEGRRVDARVRCARSIFQAWSIGRGRRVDRIALEKAGAQNGVSDQYLDGFAEMAEELGGDAKALMHALREGDDLRRHRFQSKRADKLAAWLEQHEYLDLRETLPIEKIRRRMLDECTGEIRAGWITTEECQAILDHLLAFERPRHAKTDEERESAAAAGAPE